VDLTGQLSNPQPALEVLADLDIGTPSGSAPEKAPAPGRIPRPTPRRSRPLKSDQVDALVAGYEAGKSMKELATEFGINRVTVSSYLHRLGVRLRRSGLDAEQTAQVADLYRSGWSSGRLAEHYEVSTDTVLKALRRAGVAIRPRRGG
jgi:DNA-directed RNA polymerase specialized sigma24 family protein